MSDAAIAQIVSGVVTVATLLAGFLTLWVKLKYGAAKAEEAAEKTLVVEAKIDDNTAATKAASAAAVTAVKSARAAAEAATEAREVLDRKLNGGVDSAVESALRPIREAIQDHAARHESDMREVRSALAELRQRLK